VGEAVWLSIKLAGFKWKYSGVLHQLSSLEGVKMQDLDLESLLLDLTGV